jgi:peptide/nickel transport system substrate-binding protein
LLKFRVAADVLPDVTIPTGDLAESWQQADPVTYVFKLRPGVKFQNIPPVSGREVVAEDVVFSYRRQVAERVNAALLSSVARIEAVDKNTVKFTLERPDADFLVTLADSHNKVIPREAVELRGDLKEGPTIGTGPWIVDKFDLNAGVQSLVRNPDYFIKGQPYLERISFLSIADEAARTAAFRAKQLTVLVIGAQSVTDTTAVRREIPDLKVIRSKRIASGSEFGLKVDQGPTSDVRVRRAILKAMDPQQVVDTTWSGFGYLSPGIRVPGPDWLIPEDEMKNKWFKRDVSEAKRLLAEAGTPNPSLEISVGDYGTTWTSSAELIAAQLGEAGIKATIKPISTAQFVANITTKGEYQAYIGPLAIYPSANAQLMAYHHSTGPRNTVGLTDDKLDGMIEAQYGMASEAERKRALLEIQRYVLDQAYWWLYHTAVNETLLLPWVQDFYESGLTEPDKFSLTWFDR